MLWPMDHQVAHLVQQTAIAALQLLPHRVAYVYLKLASNSVAPTDLYVMTVNLVISLVISIKIAISLRVYVVLVVIKKHVIKLHLEFLAADSVRALMFLWSLMELATL